MVFRGKFQVLGLIAMFALMCSADTLMAQPGGGRRGGGGGFQVSGLQLLGQENVQKELELVDDQVENLKDIQDEQREAMRDAFTGMRDRFQGMDRDEQAEAWGKIQKEMAELNKEFDDRANEILLPVQIDRLKQLVVQSQARRSGGASSGALPESIVEELGITEEQLEKMKAKAEEVREKMNEKIAKIRAQAEEEIMSVLDADQRARYKEMVGDSFDFGQNQGGFGGQQRGGQQRGGQQRGGGNRGGGGGGGDRGSDF